MSYFFWKTRREKTKGKSLKYSCKLSKYKLLSQQGLEAAVQSIVFETALSLGLKATALEMTEDKICRLPAHLLMVTPNSVNLSEAHACIFKIRPSSFQASF